MSLNRSLAFFIFLGLGLVSKQGDEVFSFELGSSVGSQSLFAELQSAFTVLDAACLEELDHSLFVAVHSADLGNDLTDESGAFSADSLSPGVLGSFSLLVGEFELGDTMALVYSPGYGRRMRFSHIN